MSLLSEIREQPAVARRVIESRAPVAERIAATVRERPVDFVYLAGRGTSDHAGIYAGYVLGMLNRLAVALASPSLVSMYGAPPDLSRALVIGISQSGRSPDIVGVVAEGRRQGAPTIAITNAADSPLAAAAEFTLDVAAGPEESVAATKTYTAELLAVAMLSAALAPDGAERLHALEAVPGAMEDALAAEGEADRLARLDRAMTRAVTLARGLEYATAREWALKLKELCQVLADPYSTADFQHGPLALLEPGFPVLAVAPSGAVLPDVLALLGRLRDDAGARLLVVTDTDEAAVIADATLRFPPGLPEWLKPLVSIIPAQLYGYHLARAKGLDVEAPRGLHKVTLTR